MDVSIQTQVTMWLLLIAFIIHDGEEVVTIAAWLTRHRQDPLLKLEPTTRLFHPQKSITGQFLIAVSFPGIIIASVCYLSTRAATTQSDLHMFAAVVGVLLVDGIKHVVVAMLFRGYTPGVITAVLVEVPYAVWMIQRMFNENLVTWTALSHDTVVGIMAIAVLLIVAFGLGRILMPLRREATMPGRM